MNTPPDASPVWRNAAPRVGIAWVKCSDIGVPCGWKVRVRALSDGTMCAFVEAVGIARRVYCHHLDFGIELRTARGRWLPDGDYRSRRWLWRARRAMNVGRLPCGAQGLTLKRVDEILVRYQPELKR